MGTLSATGKTCSYCKRYVSTYRIRHTGKVQCDACFDKRLNALIRLMKQR